MFTKNSDSFLIGLTGGIASGKSTIIGYLNKSGYSTIDADKLGHKILEPGNPSYQRILEKFGKEILESNGSVNRRKLGGIVFSNPEKLKQLNEISHPAIAKMIKKEYEKKVLNSLDRIVFLEAALLIETNWYKFCEQTWLVILNSDIAAKRLQLRDGLSKTEAEYRMKAQISNESRLKFADVVLKNDKSTEDLICQTNLALENFKSARTK